MQFVIQSNTRCRVPPAVAIFGPNSRSTASHLWPVRAHWGRRAGAQSLPPAPFRMVRASLCCQFRFLVLFLPVWGQEKRSAPSGVQTSQTHRKSILEAGPGQRAMRYNASAGNANQGSPFGGPKPRRATVGGRFSARMAQNGLSGARMDRKDQKRAQIPCGQAQRVQHTCCGRRHADGT